jgi:hypothetical protein
MFRLALYSLLPIIFWIRECHKIQPCNIASLPPSQKPARSFTAQASSMNVSAASRRMSVRYALHGVIEASVSPGAIRAKPKPETA